MATSYSPPWSARPEMRISDAERAAAAERLCKHFSDGRLDQAEFDVRLDQAMRAKTESDLTGLFADLPESAPVPAPVRHRHRLLFLLLLVALTASIGSTIFRPHVPWLLIGLLVFLWLRRGRWHRHRHW